jgi:tryptophanyl-tRNA synthetase
MVILIADGPPGADSLVHRDDLYEMAAAWLAAGLSPNETLLARLSTLVEIDELASLLTPFAVQGMTIPTEIYQEACALIALQATHAPSHPAHRATQNLAATIVHAFNTQINARLPEPAWLALPEDHLPGLDGNVMRTSAGNAILLGDSEESTALRLANLPDSWDGREALHTILNRLPSKPGEERPLSASPEYFRRHAAEAINEYLHSLRVKRMKWLATPSELEGVLQYGSRRARVVASETLAEVRQALSRA